MKLVAMSLEVCNHCGGELSMKHKSPTRCRLKARVEGMVAKHRTPSGTQAASKSLEQFGPAKMISAAKSPPKAASSGNTKIRWTWPFSEYGGV